jgi:hypothetical protein
MDHYGTMALVGTTRDPVTVRRVKEYNVFIFHED